MRCLRVPYVARVHLWRAREGPMAGWTVVRRLGPGKIFVRSFVAKKATRTALGSRAGVET